MKPTKQLIRGLRETAQRLRDRNVYYDWHMLSVCNCGQLAQTIMGVSRLRLLDHVTWMGCGWTVANRKGQLYCPATGVPLNVISRALSEAGIEESDYQRIEYLEDDDGITREPNFKNRRAVAAWMDAEADKLEARRAAGERPERRQA